MSLRHAFGAAGLAGLLIMVPFAAVPGVRGILVVSSIAVLSWLVPGVASLARPIVRRSRATAIERMWSDPAAGTPAVSTARLDAVQSLARRYPDDGPALAGGRAVVQDANAPMVAWLRRAAGSDRLAALRADGDWIASAEAVSYVATSLGVVLRFPWIEVASFDVCGAPRPAGSPVRIVLTDGRILYLRVDAASALHVNALVRRLSA